MTTELRTERRGTTLVMSLTGPGKRNALSPQVYAAGVETLNMAETNPEVRCIVLTGDGAHFCAGGDLQRLAHNRLHDVQAQGATLDAFHQWIEALRSFPKPVIAAVEGVAAGAGVSLALACDLVVAAENARFILSYSRVGLSPDGGVSRHLTQALGRARALAALWLGEEHSAAQWLAWGLAMRVVPAGQALDAALALSDELAGVAAGVLSSIKELTSDADKPLRIQLEAEKQHFLVNLLGPEAGQRIEAFLQRPAGPR